MVSALDLAKRALVTVLRAVALCYNVPVQVTRESGDAALASAYRAVSRKAHPDRGRLAIGLWYLVVGSRCGLWLLRLLR